MRRNVVAKLPHAVFWLRDISHLSVTSIMQGAFRCCTALSTVLQRVIIDCSHHPRFLLGHFELPPGQCRSQAAELNLPAQLLAFKLFLQT